MIPEEEVTDTIDAKGEVCPIPLAKTKDAVDGLTDGDVLEVLATEQNSLPDFESWAEITQGVELLDQVETEEDGQSVYKHYVRKSNP